MARKCLLRSGFRTRGAYSRVHNDHNGTPQAILRKAGIGSFLDLREEQNVAHVID